MTAPAVYTIPAGVPFVDALAAGIWNLVGRDIAALPRVRVLLPNRRACRSLMLAFLRLNEGRPLLLPRLTPFGDLDDDELTLSESDAVGTADALLIPPAIPPLRRLLLLTRLIRAQRSAIAYDQAARLARELARLIDQVHTERLSFSDLDQLVPEDLAAHWQVTLLFLKIITERWPQELAREGCLDPADRRNRLLDALGRMWRSRPPATPVIAAGSTGSIPATADLIAVVATLPRGAVVLPGLDVDADDPVWHAIHDDPLHPQFGLARLLKRLGVARRQVQPWPAVQHAATAPARAAVVQHALRPAACAHVPDAIRPIFEPALRGVGRVDVAGIEEEARAIALIMREALEQPEQTAALVTADRGLARRVAMELERWGIEVDDSAGQRLANTPAAVFLRLIAEVASDPKAPVPLLALLKHPLAAVRLDPARCRTLVRTLELTLRTASDTGPLPLAEAIEGAGDAVRKLMHDLRAAIDPLTRLLTEQPMPLSAFLKAHAAAAEAIATTDRQMGAERLWAGDDGEAVANFIAELADMARDAGSIDPDGYAPLFEELLGDRVLRPRYGRHPRLAIWGSLEARLQHADVMILGALNEGSWPPEVAVSPWMSRPMMQAFGLPPPERRIGLSAHDFAQAFCAPVVWLSRCERREGAPTVPSRWLLRLDALLRGEPAAALTQRGAQWASWQALLDGDGQPRTTARIPQPRPPLAARPREMSASDITTLINNPYALYARKILRLRPLEPLDPDTDGADYGTFIHRALDAFTADNPAALPEDALPRLRACGERAFGNHPRRPGIRTFWWPRFELIATWFIDNERRRQDRIRCRFSEVRGLIVVENVSLPFTIKARADRIDMLADGSIIIVDYKTGSLPKQREVEDHRAPQLPIEAWIASRGGFEGIIATPVAGLQYWQLRGRDNRVMDLGQSNQGGNEGGGARKLAEAAGEHLARLITLYDDPATAYVPRFGPDGRFPDYQDLARVHEWSAGAEELE